MAGYDGKTYTFTRYFQLPQAKSTAPSSSDSNSNSSSVDVDKLHRNAKDLAQQQLDSDLKKMGAAHGYRSAETDQTRGWDRTIQGDKLASDERINTYGVDADKWKTAYTVDADKWKTQYTTDAQERMQLKGFGQEKDMANLSSTLRMREGEQQYGFQMGLQQDNNAAKERMQQAGFKQERDVLEQKNQIQQESMRTSALRAARAFRGQIPMGI